MGSCLRWAGSTGVFPTSTLRRWSAQLQGRGSGQTHGVSKLSNTDGRGGYTGRKGARSQDGTASSRPPASIEPPPRYGCGRCARSPQRWVDGVPREAVTKAPLGAELARPDPEHGDEGVEEHTADRLSDAVLGSRDWVEHRGRHGHDADYTDDGAAEPCPMSWAPIMNSSGPARRPGR